MMAFWNWALATVLATAGPSAVTEPRPSEAVRFAEASVVSVGVVHAAGRAEAVIGVAGRVIVRDFVLRDPDRIVLDLAGATLGLPVGDAYDRVTRGGIVNVRYSQFSEDVVRVVFTLEAPRQYRVLRGDGTVRVLIDGTADGFASWGVGLTTGSGASAPAATSAPVAAAQSAPRAPAQPVAQSAAAAPTFAATQHDPVRAAPPVARASVAAQQQQRRVTVSFEQSTIPDFVAFFAAFSGRTIIPSRSVQGTITGSVVDRPWDVAMRAFLNANGFDATEDDNGIIIIDTYDAIRSRQPVEPMTTRTIRLNYAKANAVAPMLERRLSRTCPQQPQMQVMQQAPTQVAPNTLGAGGVSAQQPPMGAVAVNSPMQQANQVMSLDCPVRGAVTADSLTNSVSLTDTPAALQMLEEYARSLDLRQPQVNIRAKIISVDRSSLEAMGLRYDLGTRTQFFNDIVPRMDSGGRGRTDAGQIFLGGNTLSAIANAAARVPGSAVQLVYSTALGAYDFSTFLEALQQTSLLDVQAEPSATVLNNYTANLTAGTEVPVRVVEAGTGGNATGNFPRATAEFRQTGVILSVTPQITSNGYVQMRLHVENSDVQLVASDVGAVFPTQKVTNVVLVADGETAVMGGLTQTSVRVTRSGIPFLVDLPVIGRLFGVTQRQESRRDLLILITPHILDEGTVPPPDRLPPPAPDGETP
jgi:type IV pilus assembly protein PilQ